MVAVPALSHYQKITCFILRILPEFLKFLISHAATAALLMKDRQHTLNELKRMEQVRNYLIENGVIDSDGLIEYNKEA